MPSLPRFLLYQPRRIFLIDGLGACLTAILLLGVLVPLEQMFGMPATVLYVLGGIAGVLAVYSLACYRLAGQRLRPLLRAVSLANLLYCCLTMGLVIALWSSLSKWGVMYFLAEITVIIVLVTVEWQVMKETGG